MGLKGKQESIIKARKYDYVFSLAKDVQDKKD